MGIGEFEARVKGYLIPSRIARLLVTTLFLASFVIAGPIFTPQYSAPMAEAATPGITTDGLVLDWNTSDSADRNIATGVVPTYTTSGGGYYDLNGSTQYIFPNQGTTIGNVGGVRYLSVFMWVYPKGAGQLLTQQDGTTLNCCYHTAIMEYTSADQLHVGLWNGGDQTSINLSSTIATPKNNWYLVGLVYDGTKINGYINGVSAGSSSPFTYVPPATAFYGIGANDVTNIIVPESKGNMRVAGLYVYNRALSASEANSNFGVTASRFGPTLGNPSNQSTFTNKSATFSVAACTGATSGSATCTYQWQVSSDGGLTFSNISGATSNSYTTPALTVGDNNKRYRVIAYDPGTGTTTAQDVYTTSAAATLNVSTPPGSDTDTALTLNGTSQYAEVVDSADSLFDITGNITLEAWVFPTSSCTSDQGIISKFNSYMLYCGGGAWKYVFDADGASWSGTGTTIAIRQNEWQHVAFVKSSTTLFIYINGQLLATITGQPSTMSANNGAFSVGRYGSGNYFQGRIDEVRVYNTARTQADIQSDMNTYGSVTDSNLRSYFDFNEGSGNTLYNRASGSSTSSDLTVVGSPSWPENITPSTSQAYTIRTFTRSYLTSSGGWKVPAGVRQVSTLVVAGGGGGGSDEGGGGGGGGFLETTLTSLSSSYLTVQVGQGGLGAYGGDELTKGANGQNSVFSSLTAIGGGGGGSSVNTTSTLRNGSSGGSGGGGAGESFTNRLGGSGTSGQGFEGGAGGAASSTARGGGGGGAGQPGLVGGAGGAGKASTITGTSVVYAGGGGGGHGNSSSGTGAAGGTGGGGTGGDYNSVNTRGTANTGGGGGGGCGDLACGDWNAPFSGASGGSGIIIVRWITASAPTYTAPAAIDTTTALTRYTFRAGGSATSPLIRNFQWQSSTDTGTTWTTVQASTSDSYTTGLLDLGTSGSRYRYRVIVTDSDTAGLSISDSSTSYLVLNRYPTISPPSSNDAGLLVHLDASQAASYSGSGSTWNDISGGGRNADLGISSGGPQASGYASGVTCSAPSFNTSNGGVFDFSGNTISAPRNCAWIPNSRYADVGETFTVQMWVRPTRNDHSSWSSIISTPWVSGNKINFAIIYDGTSTDSNQNLIGGYFDGSTWFTTPSSRPVITNSWNHLALVSVNRSLTLYVNGMATSSVALTSPNLPITGASKGVLIGQRWDNLSNFSGSIGMVKIAATGMTSDQIRQEQYLSSNRFSNSASGVKSSTTTYATTLTETFTATNGTGTKRFTFTPNNRAGIVWDTSTANSAVLRVTNQLNAGTYYETMTATDSATAATTLALTITVDKARQASLSIGQYNAFVGTSTYPINVYGGSGTGAVTRSRLSAGSANCTLASGMFLTATSPGTCSVQAVKAGDTNYLSETATATIYWIQWSDAYATRAPSTPTEIVLNHSTAITKYNYDTLTVTSYQNSSGVTITSIATGATLRIIGDGFDPTSAYTEVVFASMDALDLTSGLQVISSGGSNYLQLTVPSGVTTGAITVNSPKGTAVGPVLTITP